MRLSYDFPSRLARSLLTVLMALAWCGAASPSRARAIQVGGQGGQAGEGDAQSLRRAADGLARAMKAVADFDQRIPRDTFDPQIVIRQCAGDPAALAQWVRANTRWVPYDGALRGAVGVLMDRQGNSLDRALLLAHLLRLTGKTVRLAYAKRDEAQAQQFLQAVAKQAAGQSTRTPPQQPPPGDDETALNRFAADHGIPPASLRNRKAQTSLRVQRLTEQMAQRVADAKAELSRIIGAALQPAAAADDPAKAAAVEHWWVQASAGDGPWSDFDPAPAQDGAASPTPAKTVEFDRDSGRPAIDSAAWHEINVRVIVERWDGTRLVQSPVLARALRTAELGGQRVAFRNVPAQWPGDLNLLDEKDPAGRLRQAVLAQKEWVPALVIGTETVMQAGVNDDGTVDPKPQLDATAQAGQTLKRGGQGALDGFKLGDEKPAAPPSPAGVWTGEWLEFEIRVPGGKSRTHRRQVFDLLGPATRAAGKPTIPQATEALRTERGLALLGQSELLAVGCQLSAPYVAHAGAADTLRQQEALQKLLQDPNLKGSDLAAQVNKLSTFPSELLALAVCRNTWNQKSADTYLAEPNLFCLHTALRPGGGDSAIVVRRTLDIVNNRVGVRGGTPAAAFDARLSQGIIDTQAEALLLADRAQSRSAADLFTRGLDQGVRWQLVRSPQDLGFQTARLPADARARVEQDLHDGYVAVVPDKPVASAAAGQRVVWWRIDPSTGDAVGMGDTGEGQSATEYAFLVYVGVGVVTMGGCGGFTPGVSPLKFKLCLTCAIVAACLAAALIFEIAAAAALWGFSAGLTLSGTAVLEALAEMGVEAICNLIDWGMT